MLFRWLVLRGKAPLVKLLIWWKGDTLPLNHGLCWACQKGHVDVVGVLLKHGADVNTSKGAPLRIACYQGHLDAVTALLDAGAEVDAHRGAPLQMAASKGYLDIVEVLLSRGADPMISHKSCLWWARRCRNERVVRAIERAIDGVGEPR